MMDRDTIYLDNDDEITSVIDKLKGSDFAAVDLVIPKEALVLKSVVNLKLLKKQAESLNKEIVIVTQDKVGKKLAAQIGIPVIEKPGQEPPEVRMTEGEESPGAVTGMAAGAAAAAVAGKALSEDDIEVKENASPRSAIEPEESDGIELKEAASPIEPTKEVVGATAGTSEATLSDGSNLKGKKKKRLTWKGWTLIAAFGGLALFVAAYIYLPMATVVVHLAAEKKSVDFSFTADKKYTEVDTSAQTIPASVVTVEKTKDQQFTATGKKKTGTKATGTVTIYNNGYDSDPITIVAGTRLITAGNLVFRTTSNVTLPGSYLDGGNIVVTSVSTQAQADQVGSEYNISSGTNLAIPAIGSSKVYGKSASAFAGGTSRDIIYVTQTDVNSAKEEIAKTMESELVNEATDKAGDGYRILEKAYKITEVSATPSPAVDEEGSTFTLTVKSKIDAVSFREDDLTKLATTVLGDQIGSGKEIVDASSITAAAELTDSDLDNGSIEVKVSGEAYIATNLDENDIKTNISGEPNDKALEYLNGLDGVDDTEITKQFPSFLKRLPRLSSHIYLKEELNKD